ncbi:uncharacterized protein LOC142644405 [Castanea sativa]|uniref:uncharacterized protein LOC142644405 n=1 Tax=Castanea sativa TaxID=21020 RepID=UPI003F64C74D
MTRMFRDKIGHTVEVYIDDMVIKSKREGQHIDDLKEVFEILRRHQLLLNADKCAFGVGASKFLGYLITKREIEVNPDQIEAMKCLKAPSNPKEVQKLTGMLAALNRFISKFADWCRPFYQLLKKWKGLQWNEECDKAFQNLKEYLRQEPMLIAPELGKDLYMYLLVSEHAPSAILLREKRTPPESCPITFRPIRLCPDRDPLQSLLKRSDFTGRIAKWGTRLGAFDIGYKLRRSVKGQVLANFIVEFSSKILEMVCHVIVIPWKVFVDSVSNVAGAGAKIVVITPKGIKLEHSFRLGFRAFDNEAEYEALLAGLRVVSDLGAKEVEVYLDSWLVVNQVKGSFEAKDLQMIEYLWLVKQTMGHFSSVRVEQVARGQNRHADSLATLAALVANEVPRLIKVELVAEPPSINAKTGVSQISIAWQCWMDPIVDFLVEDRVPEDEKEAARVRRTAARYWLSADRKLYQRSFEGLYLQCLQPSKIGELLAKLHEGVCGSHVNEHSLAHQAMTQGFWWPQMQKDAIEYAQSCE